jgi:hypothetical protein
MLKRLKMIVSSIFLIGQYSRVFSFPKFLKASKNGKVYFSYCSEQLFWLISVLIKILKSYDIIPPPNRNYVEQIYEK